MSRRCATCCHRNRLSIDRKLIAGANVAQLARDYGLSYNCLNYHKRTCLTRQLLKSAEIRETMNVETIAGDFQALYFRLNRLLDEAEQSKKTITFLEISKEIRSTSEFIFRMIKSLSEMQEKTEQKECPCGGTYEVYDVSKLDFQQLEKLIEFFSVYRDDKGRPVPAAPTRQTTH